MATYSERLTSDIATIVVTIGQCTLLESYRTRLFIVRRRTVSLVALDTLTCLGEGMVAIAWATVKVRPLSPEASVIGVTLLKIVARLNWVLNNRSKLGNPHLSLPWPGPSKPAKKASSLKNATIRVNELFRRAGREKRPSEETTVAHYDEIMKTYLARSKWKHFEDAMKHETSYCVCKTSGVLVLPIDLVFGVSRTTLRYFKSNFF